MPEAQFQITVKLEERNSCMGCPCRSWEPMYHVCGMKHKIAMHAFKPIRPDSCKAHDETSIHTPTPEAGIRSECKVNHYKNYWKAQRTITGKWWCTLQIAGYSSIQHGNPMARYAMRVKGWVLTCAIAKCDMFQNGTVQGGCAAIYPSPHFHPGKLILYHSFSYPLL